MPERHARRNRSTLYQVETGKPHPLGATPDEDGINFSLFSRNATAVELLLFDNPRSTQPFQVIPLDRRVNYSFFFWHVYVKGLKPGALYAYRVDGPQDVQAGHRFDKDKVLIDPYARGNDQTLWDRGRACQPSDNVATAMRSVVMDASGYDWEGDRPLQHPLHDTIIYEMHVGGLQIAHLGRPTPRHVPGRDRKNPLSQGTGRHGGRANACVRVRRLAHAPF